MKIIFLLAGFVGLGLLAEACLEDDGGCGGFPQVNVKIVELTISSRNVAGQEIDTAEYFEHNLIVKVISITEIMEAIMKDKGHPSVSGFFPRALACSPPLPRIINPIASVNITTENAFLFNDQIGMVEKGEDISGFFEVSANYRDDFGALDDYFDSPELMFLDDSLYLRISEAPSENANIRMTLSVELSDGTIFEFENEVMNLSP